MEIGILKKEDFQVYVPFGDAEVLVAFVSRQENKKLIKKATKIRYNDKHQKVKEFDVDEHIRLLTDAAIKGWSGITMDGEEYPYSQANAAWLVANWIDFANFVGNTGTDLETLQVAEEDALAKNSSLTSGQEESIEG